MAITHSAEETIAFGQSLKNRLTPPKVVILSGPLGAGKTTLVKGIAEAFATALRDEVSSPTFTLIHEYRGPQVSVYHVDLYRIDTERELGTLGLEELFQPDNVVLIEWGEKFPRLLRDCDTQIQIARQGENEREIRILAMR